MKEKQKPNELDQREEDNPEDQHLNLNIHHQHKIDHGEIDIQTMKSARK